MATVYDINPNNITITRQGKTNNFWASWSFTDSQNKRTISKKV